MKKVLMYIVYGDNIVYYTGAKFSILSFSNFIQKDDNVEIVVITENPSYFESFPVTTVKINQEQINDWSIQNQYHFRIKNRAMAYAIDQLNLRYDDKILFFDTDSYFESNPLKLFDLITPNQTIFYKNEGLIYSKKRFKVYVDSLENNPIQVDENFTYKLTKQSALWGSAIIGITAKMKNELDLADKLMLKFFKIVNSHTIEPFSLSEVLLTKYNMVEGRKFVSLYSTSAKKVYARQQLDKFFKNQGDKNFEEQKLEAKKVNLKRPILHIIKQRINKMLTTGESPW